MQRTTQTILLPVNIEPSTSTEVYTIVPDKSMMATSSDTQQSEDRELTPAETETTTATDDSRTPSPAGKKVKLEEVEEEEEEKKDILTDLKIDINIVKTDGGPTSSISSDSSNFDTAVASTSALDENAEQKPKPKRRQRQKVQVVEEASRKSNRINKSLEKSADVIDNYTGQKDIGKPRGNQVPVGLKRVHYEFPARFLKENGRLRIDMNGPSTRSNPSDEIAYTPMQNRARGNTYGPEFQATLPPCEPDQPDDGVCREEAIWTPPIQQKFSDDELNAIYIACQKQYGVTMPLDAVLHRLMISNYDVDEMLATIERERERLPQPFLNLSEIQQAEFEKQTRKARTASNTTNRTIPRAYRNMQERFLRNHHLGEIISYYYNTKKKCCSQKQYNRCKCREAMVRKDDQIVERVECSNCTKLVRPNAAKSQILCLLCKLYFERNNKHRSSQHMFNDEEEKLLTKWNEIETATSSIVTLSTVKAKLEEERVADLASRQLTADEVSVLGATKRKDRVQVARLFAPYTPEYNLFCDPNADATSTIRLKDYDEEQKYAFLQCFEKYGKDYGKTAATLNCSVLEVSTFFYRFRRELNLIEFITEAQNNNNIHHTSNNNPTSRQKQKESRNASRDSTPYEPTERVAVVAQKVATKPTRSSTIMTRKRLSDATSLPPKRRSRGI